MNDLDSINEEMDVKNWKNHKCTLIRSLHFFPYKRCRYCDLELYRCFGGFIAPILMIFILILLVIVRESNNEIVSGISMGMIILCLIFIVTYSNRETNKLTINNFDLKFAEKSLRISEEKYHLLYSSLPGGSFTVNSDFIITDVNDVLCKVTEYDRDELVGNKCNIICPKGPHKCPIFDMGKKRIDNDETSVKRRDGIHIPIIKSAIRIKKDNGDVIIENFQDITEKIHAEEEMKKSLEEKNVLLQEIHHRVKNNLQVISSLLNLQSEYIKDPKTIDMFKESQNRIRSMALIHEQLYQSKDLAKIDIREYIQNLTHFLFRSYKINVNFIKLITEIDDVQLSINKAISCGLIINELVSNSLKYAFPMMNGNGIPGNKDCQIFISLYPFEETDIKLIVKDNGTNFPSDINFQNTKTLGLQLVNMLTHQLHGNIDLDLSQGTKFEIVFQK